MATAMRTIRPPVKRHGGKFYLAKRIIALMPEHHTYVEPFVGGGSVLLNKPPSEVEIASDLDAGLIGMWQCLADRRAAMVRAILGTTEYLEDRFDIAHRSITLGVDPPGCPSHAICYIVRSRFSRGGLGKTFAWSERLRGGQPGDANAWDTFRKVDLPAICERVKGVKFFHADALPMIQHHGVRGALIYADPPYLHETRTARKAYEHEMTREHHVGLLRALCQTPAKVMLSGYRSEMYDAELSGWRRVDFEMPNNSGQGRTKQRRVECLWMNYAPEDAQ